MGGVRNLTSKLRAGGRAGLAWVGVGVEEESPGDPGPVTLSLSHSGPKDTECCEQAGSPDEETVPPAY